MRHLSYWFAAVAVTLIAGGAAACSGGGRGPQAGVADAAASTVAQAASPAAPGVDEMLVYKSPTCGCCTKWVDYMRAAGFRITVKDVPDINPIKAETGVPGPLQSCHTGIVAGYVIEGHVPADLVRTLLRDRPKVAGLAVPGMVTGSPGMEGSPAQAYDVVSFDARGQTAVFAKR